jgi:flagellar basal body L-ring protein FlgH
MKTITINGVEVKIGDKVRYVNDKDLYIDVEGVIKPRTE